MAHITIHKGIKNKTQVIWSSKSDKKNSYHIRQNNTNCLALCTVTTKITQKCASIL